jgi:hypothetical protein
MRMLIPVVVVDIRNPRKAGLSLVTSHLGTPCAVVDVGTNANHATGAGIVC